MAENREEQTLSTADMAAAAESQQSQTPDAAVATSTPDKPSPTPASQPATPGDGASLEQAAGMQAGDGQKPSPLLAENMTRDLHQRWTEVQAGFVDEPRQAVKQADGLVAEVMKQLAESFAKERTDLEQQWDRGGDVSTEDLRVALRRYRSFFERLLST
ncbi:MAG TPA: hypothetical protein VH916_08645 [Dehalococcoidia bacterium]|jgi:hypothetical protein